VCKKSISNITKAKAKRKVSFFWVLGTGYWLLVSRLQELGYWASGIPKSREALAELSSTIHQHLNTLTP